MARTEWQLTNAEMISVEELEQIPNNSVIYKDNVWSYQNVPLWDTGEVLTSNGATIAPSFDVPTALTPEQTTQLNSLQDTGIFSYDGSSVSATPWNIVIWAWSWQTRDYTTWLITNVTWGLEDIPALNIGTQTNGYIFKDSTGATVQTNTLPTDINKRDWIFLGRWTSLDNVIVALIEDKPVLLEGTTNSLRDLADLLWFIKKWIVFSWIPWGLSVSRTAGTLFELWVNYTTNPEQPNNTNVSALSPVNVMRKATQTWPVDVSPVSVIDTNNYDLWGIVTALAVNKYANIRVIQFPSWNVGLYYGQTQYNSMNEALVWIDSDPFVQWPTEAQGMWVATITHVKWATNFSTTTDIRVSVRDDLSIWTSGNTGLSTATLQEIYTNSSNPEIITDNTRWALSLQRWSSTDTDNVLEVKNGAWSTVFNMNGQWTWNISWNLTITWDLTVNWTTTTINSQDLVVTDNTIVLNNWEVWAWVTAWSAGIEVDRWTLTDYQFIFDETTDSFKVWEIGSLQKVATREDSPIDTAYGYWDSASNSFKTDSKVFNATWGVLKVGDATAAWNFKIAWQSGISNDFNLTTWNLDWLQIGTNSSPSLVTVRSTGDIWLNTPTPAVRLENKSLNSWLPASSWITQTNWNTRMSSTVTTGVIDFWLNSDKPWIQSTDSTNLGVYYNLALNPNWWNVGIGLGNSAAGATLDVWGEIKQTGTAWVTWITFADGTKQTTAATWWGANFALSWVLTTANNGILTFTHNQNITQADVEAGRYKVVLMWKFWTDSFQYWDTSANQIAWWTTSTEWTNNIKHSWDAADPTAANQVYHQANTFKIKLGSSWSAITNARLKLIDMFEGSFT